jgi:hypothetical protein
MIGASTLGPAERQGLAYLAARPARYGHWPKRCLQALARLRRPVVDAPAVTGADLAVRSGVLKGHVRTAEYLVGLVRGSIERVPGSGQLGFRAAVRGPTRRPAADWRGVSARAAPFSRCAPALPPAGARPKEADYVWTFVQRIRRKIEPNRREPKYLLTEPGVGYRTATNLVALRPDVFASR